MNQSGQNSTCSLDLINSGFVGWLTTEETKALAAFKATLAEKSVDCPNDQESLRFLRARKFVTDDAVVMYIKYRNWYLENRIYRYPEEFPSKARALGELVPSAFAGFDREGHPVQIERTGKIDVPTILSAVSGSAMLEAFIWGQQLQIRRCEESTARLGLPPHSIERFTQVMDLEGLSTQHLQLAQFLQPITKCGEANFPERLSKTIIINYGWVFSMLWAVVKLTLDPVTREKIIVCPSFEELHKYIDPAQLPKRYGGTQEDLPALADPDVEALRAKYLNDELYKDHYEDITVESGSNFVKQVQIDGTTQWSYCFRCSEEVKFKAVFVPLGSESDEDHVTVSVEAKVEAQKWPVLGSFTSSNGKSGFLKFTWQNDNWWGAKKIKFAALPNLRDDLPESEIVSRVLDGKVGPDDANTNPEAK